MVTPAKSTFEVIVSTAANEFARGRTIEQVETTLRKIYDDTLGESLDIYTGAARAAVARGKALTATIDAIEVEGVAVLVPTLRERAYDVRVTIITPGEDNKVRNIRGVMFEGQDANAIIEFVEATIDKWDQACEPGRSTYKWHVAFTL